jgi:DNA-binding transcriptional LysR family regulator
MSPKKKHGSHRPVSLSQSHRIALTMCLRAHLAPLRCQALRASLVSDHIANETLICPLHLAAPTAFAYYLLGLPEGPALRKIACFRDWLRAEAAAFTTT